MEIKNLKKAAQRILKAVQSKENIILYGDADLDGINSVIILKDTLKNFNGKIAAIYFANREKDGYGLSLNSLNFLKKFSPALLITLDCGISNFEEVKLANYLGFEVLIIDHHEVLEKLPKASIIVDPKQKGDKYPFKDLATVGIVYKLAQLLLREDNLAIAFSHPRKELPKNLKENFLELVALATLADMMPEEGDNKIMIEEGLSSLEKTWRPGLKVLLKILTSQNKKNSIREISKKIISILNISEHKNHLTETFLFLNAKSEKSAEKMAKKLLEKSDQRQMRIKEIVNEVGERVLKKPKESIVFEGDDNWPLVLIGSVASRVCRLYQKPVFIYKKGKSESRGSMRTLSRIDGIELMKKCSSFLQSYGGHPQAGGFLIKNENLEEFKKCLIKNIMKNYPN